MVKATVLAFITREGVTGQEILLTKRSAGLNQYPEKWCLPGGHIEEKETAAVAIAREVREEIGLEFRGEFLDYFDEIIPDKAIHAVVLQFEGSYAGGDIEDSDEVTESKWVTPLDALSLDLAFQHREVIKQYITRTAAGANEAGYLPELSYLRSEVLNRITTRNKTLHYTIILAGILLGLSETIDYRVIALFPLIGMPLAALWSHNDVRIAQIGRYIKNHIEPKVPGLNWQNHLGTVYREHKSTRFKKFQEYTVLGIFYVTYAAALFVAVMRSKGSEGFPQDFPNTFDIIIIGLDVIAFLATGWFIRRRRKGYEK